MAYRYGIDVVRERNVGSFELEIDDLFHLSFGSYNENHWDVALLHRYHHVGASFRFMNGQWEDVWLNEKWEQKGIVHPFDIICFLNTNEDAIDAFKAFKKHTLNRYIKARRSWARRLEQQMKVKLPKEIKRLKANISDMKQMLNAL